MRRFERHSTGSTDILEKSALLADQFASAVVVSRLEKDNSIVEHFVNESIDFVYAAGPDISAELLQVFRLPDSTERLAHHSVHQVGNAKNSFPVGADPVLEIVTAFTREYGHT